MTVKISELTGASNGPAGRPSMLTVGDSIMWGQGLLPTYRFREIVRQRISQDQGSQIVELAMARSGAKLHPERNKDAEDDDITISTSITNPPLKEIYSPDAYTREVSWTALTTFQQLSSAEEIMRADSDNADPREIKWILLNGGINDIGIEGILAPIPAYIDGYFVSGWNAWILDKGKQIKSELVATIEKALDLFPSAVIVVNGYYPIFSYHSIGHITQLTSVGLLYTITNIGMLQPFGLDALVSASTTWQAVSNEIIRSAIKKATKKNPGRKVLFARSNIEGSHCLFASSSWLWGYDTFPDNIPGSYDEWLLYFAGATPEDQVIKERLRKCAVLTNDIDESTLCRLASVGHPNTAGAQDYAMSIIEALEDAGELKSDLHPCKLGHRRRSKECKAFSDTWSYRCVTIDAAIGKTCGTVISGLVDTLKNQFSQSKDHFKQAGGHIEEAGDCYDDFSDKTKECDDKENKDKEKCESEYNNWVNGKCDIECTKYKKCKKKYKWYDPRRYTCLIARATCVILAAIERALCIAAAAVIREACKLAAEAKSLACKAAAVIEDTACAVVEVGKAFVDGFVGLFHGLIGVLVSVAVGFVFIQCKVGGWLINRTCRSLNWFTGKLCIFGSLFIEGLCFFGTAFAKFASVVAVRLKKN